MSVEERLRSQRAPDETEAEERAWRVLQAAFEEQRPRKHPRPLRSLRLVAAGTVVVAALAAGAGAVAGLIDDALDDEKPAPPRALRLPAAGKLLVQSEQGPWVLRRDGSKRLLGRYDGASWSPHGLFAVVWRDRELAALEPNGKLRWSINAPSEASDARWAPSGFRIAYRSGTTLRVVAGDGTADRELLPAVDRAAPAWRPGPGHVLAAALPGGRVVAIDADSGRRLWVSGRGPLPRQLEWSADGRRLVAAGSGDIRVLDAGGRVLSRIGGGAPVAFARTGHSLALLRAAGRGTEVVLARAEREIGRPRRLFLAAGSFSGIEWSPDGRWLLVAWPGANQWLFLRPDGKRLVTAVSVAQQFDPGATTSGRSPQVGGWAP